MVTEEVQAKYARTNIFVIDEGLWAWAQYKAKLQNCKSVSEYLFDLIRKDKERSSK